MWISLCRSGKKVSEDAAASSASAPALSKPASASEPAAGSARNTYTGPLISRAGKRGSTAAFSSTAMAKAAAEDVRQADSAALYPAQPAYRQASVMDLLNRPQSSSSRPSGDAMRPPAHASRHARDNQQHVQQLHTAHQPWKSAAPDEGPADGGMPAMPGGLTSDLGSPLAGQSPDRTKSPSPAHIQTDIHMAELCPDQTSASEMSPSALQPDVHDSPSGQQDFPVISAAFGTPGTVTDHHPNSTAEIMDRDQSAVRAGSPGDAQPFQAELPADGVDTAGREGAADEAGPAGQQSHNQLAEIDAATWAKLPANVQASILAGEAVNLDAALHAPDAAGLAPQVLPHIPPTYFYSLKTKQTRWCLPLHI